MLSLAFKRNYKLIIIFIVIILLSIIFYNTRIVSYNFWKYKTEIENSWYNYTNSKNILDDSMIHEISIDITNKQYKYIIDSYRNNKEKEFIKADITIDWKTVENVWLRLKWDIDLLDILETNSDTDFIKLALLIKFNKYEKDQTYQWLSEIAMRVDSEDSILWQLVSFKIFRELDLLAPKSWYTTLTFWNYWTYIYMLSESIDKEYVEDNFQSNNEGVLYKALNSLSFSYLWDDPTLYSWLFEQETMENNYDMKLLNNLLKFISTSSDEEFEQNLWDYIDIDSYIWMLAMDELLWREDIFLWFLNSYYIYIETETNKASFIVRDQKMSFWNMRTLLYDILVKYYTKTNLDNLDNIISLLKSARPWINNNDYLDKTYFNDLKERFFKNSYYKDLYDEKLKEYKELIYNQGLAQNSLDYYKNTFLNYNNFSTYISYTNYIWIIETIESFINKMTNSNFEQKFEITK